MDKAAITPELVSRLVADQFPQWAGLPVSVVELDGHDNTTLRLGDELSVRLPSADAYIPQVEKEHRWLPVLAPRLPLAIPEPVARGAPTSVFPRPWSVYRWRSGEPALAGRIADETRFAMDLAAFLTALYAIDATDGPAPGAHSFFRGGPLAPFDEYVQQSIPILADELDADAVRTIWEAALATAWSRDPVWVHGDVSNSNLLAVSGRLSAVLDFGCSAVGDPACDLAIAWTFFSGESRRAFRAALPFDEETWARGRGWALWKALNTRAKVVRAGPDGVDAAARFGWRLSSRGVLDEVLAGS